MWNDQVKKSRWLISWRHVRISVGHILAGAGHSRPRLHRMPEPSPAQRVAWFSQAKFGMFIHWGPYSLASVEASWPIMRPSPRWNITEAEYVALYQRFNPEQFDPKAWVSLATDAGMRYMVFTTKHHDGFCMFDTSLTEYKITKTPYGRDVTAMLAKAAHDARDAFGFLLFLPGLAPPGLSRHVQARQ